MGNSLPLRLPWKSFFGLDSTARFGKDRHAQLDPTSSGDLAHVDDNADSSSADSDAEDLPSTDTPVPRAVQAARGARKLKKKSGGKRSSSGVGRKKGGGKKAFKQMAKFKKETAGASSRDWRTMKAEAQAKMDPGKNKIFAEQAAYKNRSFVQKFPWRWDKDWYQKVQSATAENTDPNKIVLSRDYTGPHSTLVLEAASALYVALYDDPYFRGTDVILGCEPYWLCALLFVAFPQKKFVTRVNSCPLQRYYDIFMELHNGTFCL